jgi:hypothetical protein
MIAAILDVEKHELKILIGCQFGWLEPFVRSSFQTFNVFQASSKLLQQI